MTRHTPEYEASDSRDADASHEVLPLETWITDLAREVVAEDDAATPVPREMMWARIQRDRAQQQHNAPHALHTPLPATPMVRTGRFPWRRVTGIAALLMAGVAVGRYVIPARSERVASADVVATESDARGAPGMAAALSPEALAALPRRTDPAHVAMSEHLARTVSLLTTVRDHDPATGPGADISEWARELLRTTRLLLDQPALRDDGTRRLLEDLELVLVQIIQARSSAPETERAPSETMRETNLLPRVRAVMTASRTLDESISGGD